MSDIIMHNDDNLYDHFGNILSQAGLLADANVYRFSSKEFHRNSDIVYYLYRYYDSNLQRWLNRDPIGERGGVNLYRPMANNTVGNVDVDGRSWRTTTGPKAGVDFGSVICMNGKPVPYIPKSKQLTPGELKYLDGLHPGYAKSYSCYMDCVNRHEQSHADDALAENPNICTGVPNGTFVMNNDPTALYQSELKAHEISKKCLQDCQKTCPGLVTMSMKDSRWRRTGRASMFTSRLCRANSTLLSIASGLLAVLFFLSLGCKNQWSKVIKDPIQVTVQPDQSKSARTGDLRVTVRNRSTEDLVFQSGDLPWEINAGGIDFVIHRTDGSVVRRMPMIADPIVGGPALLQRGGELSHDMSLLVYYVDLPKELALHDLKVNWSYFPKPTNSVVTKTLTGEFLLKGITASGDKP